MGQFSWLDCITEEQIVDDKTRDVYVLVPKEFGGGHIKETCYDGYGNFGGYDIYDLVAEWNREILSRTPNFILPHKVQKEFHGFSNDSGKVKLNYWYKHYSNLNLTKEEVIEKIKQDSNTNYFEWRVIGIDIACYDEDNEALPFPIKITHNKYASYELCPPSKSDPNQGWEDENEYDEDDEWEEENEY